MGGPDEQYPQPSGGNHTPRTGLRMKIIMGVAVLMEHSHSPFFILFLCTQFPHPGTSEWRSPDTPPPDNHTTAAQYDGNKFRS